MTKPPDKEVRYIAVGYVVYALMFLIIGGSMLYLIGWHGWKQLISDMEIMGNTLLLFLVGGVVNLFLAFGSWRVLSYKGWKKLLVLSGAVGVAVYLVISNVVGLVKYANGNSQIELGAIQIASPIAIAAGYVILAVLLVRAAVISNNAAQRDAELGVRRTGMAMGITDRKWVLGLIAIMAGIAAPYLMAQVGYYIGIHSPTMAIVEEYQIRNRFWISALFNAENMLIGLVSALVISFPLGLIVRQDSVKYWVLFIGAVLAHFLFSSLWSELGIQLFSLVLFSVSFMSFVFWAFVTIWFGTKVGMNYFGSSNKSAQPTQ